MRSGKSLSPRSHVYLRVWLSRCLRSSLFAAAKSASQIERPLVSKLSVLVVRLAVSAMLVLLGWVTTVGTITILNRNEFARKSL